MPPTTGRYSIHRITGPDDAAWPQWKAIYDISFDVSERISDRSLLGLLSDNNGDFAWFLWMETEAAPGVVSAISLHTTSETHATSVLWYLATKAEARNLGLGAILYRDIISQCESDRSRMLLFEVEIPEVAGIRGEADAEFARRRIAWYRRQGARLLYGIHYVQCVDTGEPPVEMHLMAHTFAPSTPLEVFTAAVSAFGDAVELTGELDLV